MLEKYEALPYIVEAVQFTDENKDMVYHALSELNNSVRPTGQCSDEPGLIIPTLEGDMLASLGDYIVRGIQGELYPCKPDIFEKTHRRLSDGDGINIK